MARSSFRRLPLVLTLGLVACRTTVERTFFDGYPGTREERLTHYSLEDQYRIYRYGMDHVEPPTMGLEDVIAKEGQAAVPFLVTKLNENPDDQAICDILRIFDAMQLMGTYAVKKDAVLMKLLTARFHQLRDPFWISIGKTYLDFFKA